MASQMEKTSGKFSQGPPERNFCFWKLALQMTVFPPQETQLKQNWLKQEAAMDGKMMGKVNWKYMSS